MIVDAGFWPIHTSKRAGGRRLLRSIAAGMLVMWDRGFHEYDLVAGVQARQAHVLSRLPGHVKPERVKLLPDGSWQASLFPLDYKRRKQGEHCLVRIIEYKVTDPALSNPNGTHRLLTTPLDPELYPDLDLNAPFMSAWKLNLPLMRWIPITELGFFHLCLDVN